MRYRKWGDEAHTSTERGLVERMSDRRMAKVLAAVIALSYAYFFQGGGYNQNTRLDVVYAILHSQTLQIDDVHDNTEDKALFNGHHYCDKAPGLQLLALPFVFISSTLISAMGLPLTDCRGFTLLAYIATLVAAGGVSVWSAMIVFRLVRLLGGTQEGAAMATLALALGSPMWAYATLFWGHALVASLLITALWLGVTIRGASHPCTHVGLWAGLGACAGWAALTAYPAVVPALTLVLAVIGSTLRRVPWRSCLPCVVAASLAALGCLTLLLAHNQAVAGSPFALSYTHTQGFDGMKRGFFGVGLPRLSVLWEVLLGPTRGLFLLVPAFGVGVMGLARMARDRQDAAFAGRLGLCVVGFFLVLNASYFYWNGGYTYGPRHMGDGLPFYALGLGWLASRVARRSLRAALWAMVGLGVLWSLMAVSVGTPDGETLVPISAFVAGQTPAPAGSVVPQALRCEDEVRNHSIIARPIWNLGMFVGLRGLSSLLPLLGIWLFALGYVAHQGRRRCVACN